MQRAHLLGVLAGLAFLVNIWMFATFEREKHHGAPAVPLHGQSPVTAELCRLCPDRGDKPRDSGSKLAGLHQRVADAIGSIESLRYEILTRPDPAPAPVPVPLPPSSAAAPASRSGSLSPRSSGSGSGGSDGGKLPFLMIGIPTVGRGSGVDYLAQTLDRLSEQMAHDPRDPMYQQVVVVVMNNDSPLERHTAFYAAQRKHADNAAFVFVENDGSLQDADPSARDSGHANFPGWKVRKQSRDVAHTAQWAVGKSHYFLFMEDDFLICPQFMQIVPYLVRKAHSVAEEWISIKISFGMNGFILPNGKPGKRNNLNTFAEYLIEHQARRPPDHLQTEWSAGETPQSGAYKNGRPHMTYRYNLLLHIGTNSSLRPEQQGEYAGCFYPMDTTVLFEIDAFQFDRCAHDDVSPCNAQESKEFRSLPPFRLDFPQPKKGL